MADETFEELVKIKFQLKALTEIVAILCAKEFGIMVEGRRISRRLGLRSALGQSVIRSRRQHSRIARGRRVHDSPLWSKLMTLKRQVARNGWQTISRFVQRVNAMIGLIAQPSLTQLVLRIGLATPFWRSGVNKWDGFLRLNDTAVFLFSTEFKLHLPGGRTRFQRLRPWRSLSVLPKFSFR
jgi:hypothetical protein